MTNYIVRAGWAIPQVSIKSDSRHPLTDALTSVSCFFFSFKKMSLLLVIKDHKPTLWSLTGPPLLLNLICSSILQIIHSLLWISQTIRTLPGDRGENGSIWACSGSRACALSRRPRHSVFYTAVISTWDQKAPTKSQRSRRQIDPGAGREASCRVGQECLAGAKFYFGVGPLRERVCGIMEDIQTVKMEFPDCYWDLNPTVPAMISISRHSLKHTAIH